MTDISVLSLISALKDRTARAHSYGIWIAEAMGAGGSHTDPVEECQSIGCLEAMSALHAVEWGARQGCAGASMGDPPMHMHPACPVCGGIQPGTEGNCWNASAVGHHSSCTLLGAVKPAHPLALPELHF